MNRILSALLVVLALGCDRDHPARPTVDQFVEAMRYGDVDRMFELHLDSTESTRWCRDEFKTALDEARAGIDSEECQRIRSLPERDLEAMSDELRLAVQVTGWVCRHPEGTCQGYAKTVFHQAIENHPLVVDTPEKLTVRKVFGDESHAAAYLDITRANDETKHRTLKLEKVGQEWKVADGLFEEPPTAPNSP